jgi:hypothetical protein
MSRRTPTKEGVPTVSEIGYVEITQSRDLDVEHLRVRGSRTDPNFRHDAQRVRREIERVPALPAPSLEMR